MSEFLGLGLDGMSRTGVSHPGDNLLLETGDNLLLESGTEALLLE